MHNISNFFIYFFLEIKFYPLELLLPPEERELLDDLELLDERTLPEDLDEELLDDLTLPEDLDEELRELLTLLLFEDLLVLEGEVALVDLVPGLVTRVLVRDVLVEPVLLTDLEFGLVDLTVLVFPTLREEELVLILEFLLDGDAALDNLRVE